jgi:hypothetical protein
LNLLGFHRPREEWPRRRRDGRSLHLLDVGHDLGRQVGVLLDFIEGREIRECLHAVTPVDVETLHGCCALQLLEHRARDIRPLLDHGRLDAGHQGGGHAPRSHLVLLDEEALLATEGPDGGSAEADDQDRHDKQGDLGRQPRPQHRTV